MIMKLPIINEKNEKYGLNTLEKLYETKIIPREKKPYIIDYKNSYGPYMALAGDKTRYLLDASSQIASLTLGFNPTPLFGVGHIQSCWTNDLQSDEATDIKNAFRTFLRRESGHKEVGITFTNSGSESNELAFIMSLEKTQKDYPNAKKVLAFEGSFHGRMLTSLFSTWNKTKREPFEVPGKETTFVAYPQTYSEMETEATKDLLELFENHQSLNFNIKCKELMSSNDKLLAHEIECLLSVKEQIETGDHYAVIIEPMQCEGGDKYASKRFYNLLTILCKSHSIPLIMDEVQTGFYLGQDFFWFKYFNMKDSQGNELFPDYVTSAKKSQTGFVMAFDGREDVNNEVNLASITRGLYQGLASTHFKQNIIDIEKMVMNHLYILISAHEEFENPRAQGIAFSFDLKNKDNVQEFIKLRFKMGLLIYPAGERTLRFRLNTSWKEIDINNLFIALDAMAKNILNKEELQIKTDFDTSIKEHNSHMYMWHEKLIIAKKNGIASDEALKYASTFFKDQYGAELIQITDKNFDDFKNNIQTIQEQTYEETRQTSIKKFERAAKSNPSVCLGLLKDDKLIGICFGAKASNFSDERALRRAKYFSSPKALYMLDTTATSAYQGTALGRYLKYTLELVAISKGCEYIYGRNRYMLAASMLSTNLSLGAIPELFIEEDYLDDLDYRDVILYRSTLKWKDQKSEIRPHQQSALVGTSFSDTDIINYLPSMVNKVCLSNFISEDYINSLNKFCSTLPKSLQYIFTASGHSECVDKIYKSVFFTRKEEKPQRPKSILTLDSHYFGKNSTLARSVTLETFGLYEANNVKSDLEIVEKELKTESYLSLFINTGELLKTKGKSDTISFLKEIRVCCDKHNVTLTYDTTLTHNDQSDIFYQEEVAPDALFMYLTGQMAICALKEDLRVHSPLMMISTWDGDEISLHQRVMAMNLASAKKINENIALEKDLFFVNKSSSYKVKKRFPESGLYRIKESQC